MSGAIGDLLHTSLHAAKPDEMLFRFLDTAGDGTGTKNAIGNYSTPDDFYILPAAGETFFLHRMVIHIEDGAALQAGTYGNLSALTNGVSVTVQDNTGTLLDLTDGLAIKTNSQWSRYCYDVGNTEFTAGNQYVAIRWTFEKSGNPIILSGNNSTKFVVTLSDNLTGLVSHTFQVQGHKD